MGAFAAWLADLTRKIGIYSPVLVLMLGMMLAWSTYRLAVWGVLHIPIPFDQSIGDLFEALADFISESESIAVWILHMFAIDYLLQYIITLLSHLRSFLAVFAGLFSATISIMIPAYAYGRAKNLAAVLAGQRLLQ